MLLADECWIALALLHRERPVEEGFKPREILGRMKLFIDAPRAGASAHLAQHNVANVKPSSARYRMFFKLPSGELRLFRPGDVMHPDRRGKTHPRRSDLPAEWLGLLDWYEAEYCARRGVLREEEDPLLALRGSGKGLWPEGGDAFIRAERDEAAWLTFIEFERADRLWRKLIEAQGKRFHTALGKPFRYRIAKDAFELERDGRWSSKKIAKLRFTVAASRMPFRSVSDVVDLADYSYLFGLLSDPRIVDTMGRAA